MLFIFLFQKNFVDFIATGGKNGKAMIRTAFGTIMTPEVQKFYTACGLEKNGSKKMPLKNLTVYKTIKCKNTSINSPFDKKLL